MSSPQRSLVISSTSRALTTHERMQLADGRVDSADLLQVLAQFSRAHHAFDMTAMARESGTVVSAVMLGAIAGSGLFPFARAHYEAVVGAGGGASAAASLRGFGKAFDWVAGAGGGALPLGSALAHEGPKFPEPAAAISPSSDPASEAPAAMLRDFPASVHKFLALGHARVVEYQDAAYGDLYLARLRKVLAAESAADPHAVHNYATTHEMARWLALWMAFDDIVRVADLKSRASRFTRVKSEVGASDADLLMVYDHFKPGAPEFAALLPQGLADRVLRWDRARTTGGKEPWAMPLKIGTHSVLGMMALRLLANMKWLRARGSRYAAEQSMIEQWLTGVTQGCSRHWQLGFEIALCGRLIKGYGSTNERGKANLLHVLESLAHGSDAQASARSIAAAREAALADDSGKALDATLVAHGANARPVKEHPIRFVRRAARNEQ